MALVPCPAIASAVRRERLRSVHGGGRRFQRCRLVVVIWSEPVVTLSLHGALPAGRLRAVLVGLLLRVAGRPVRNASVVHV